MKTNVTKYLNTAISILQDDFNKQENTIEELRTSLGNLWLEKLDIIDKLDKINNIKELKELTKKLKDEATKN